MPYRILLLVLLMCAACDAQPTPTPTNPPTETPTATVTQAPSATAANTLAPTATPTTMPTATLTETPTITPSATITPTPFNTPFPTPVLFFDNWELVDIPTNIADGLDDVFVVYINSNNSETIRNLSTGLPPTDNETLYFASPTNPTDRTPILELDASTNNQVYVAPRGNAVAYFVNEPVSAAGMYILDVRNGLSGRILPAESMTQRGIFSPPAWRPDGSILAVTVETGYSLDILAFEVESSSWLQAVQDGSYNFWPAWSPDGRNLAFVSDRAVCPSWIPTDPNACNPDIDPIPQGGHLYVLDTVTNTITQLSEEWLTEPPYWINNRQIAFAIGGDEFDLLNQSRTLWVANVADGISRPVSNTSQYQVAESWSDDGNRVIFQNIEESSNEIVVMRSDGLQIGAVDDLSFARFTMSADWSPDGTRLAIGGSGGQCPYGIRVLDEDYDFVAQGNQPRSMCNPDFSPDGRFIAFSGVNPTVGDGRVDIYTSNNNGFNAVNLTAGLRGQMTLLGWVGPGGN